jgi:hypothetical protein
MVPELELEDEVLELVDDELLELVDEVLLDDELLELDEEVLPPGVSFPPHPTSVTAAIIKAGTKGRSDILGFFIVRVMTRAMARAPKRLVKGARRQLLL